MARTALIFSSKYYEHDTGKNHPETAKRLKTIMTELGKSGLLTTGKCNLLEPYKAGPETIQLVHAAEYMKLVEAVCKSGGGLIDLEDTIVSPRSYEIALLAAGGVVKAADLVMHGNYTNAFALVRPPGHHATRFRGLGFCIFNNVAIATRYIIEEFGLRRIMILDIDAHHGNGTQETFYDTDKVLYASLHEDPRSFPGTGFANETGEGEGLGFNVNIPLPFRTGDEIYLKALREIVVPIARQYRPQAVLVSAGFDAHHADPVGNLALTTSCIQRIFDIIIREASRSCQGKLLCVLEGGYNTRIVGKLAVSAIAKISGSNYTVGKESLTVDKSANQQAAKILKEVIRIQRPFWALD